MFDAGESGLRGTSIFVVAAALIGIVCTVGDDASVCLWLFSDNDAAGGAVAGVVALPPP